jgi:uncharacterized phage infection (PIP) family protein YhgE
MPIDASIYQALRPVQVPSALESRSRALQVTGQTMQNMASAKQLEAADRQEAAAAQKQRISAIGNALEGIAGLSDEQRATAYPQVRQELIKQGLIKPQDAPEQYDPGLYRQTLMGWRNSDEYLSRKEKLAKIAKLEAEAKNGGKNGDPLARQMALADYRDGLARKQKADEQAAELKRNTQVGGWKLADGATPTADDAKKFKSGVAAARSLLNNLNEYQALVDEYGSEMGGEVAQKMDSLARDIQLSAKNEDLYGLGVLTGPDLALLEEIIEAPTGLGANLNPFAGSKAVNKAQQFREMLNTRIGAKAKTYGFEPEEEWTTLAQDSPKEKEGFGPSAHAKDPPKHGTVKRGRDGVEYLFLGGDPAKKENWKRAR